MVSAVELSICRSRVDLKTGLFRLVVSFTDKKISTNLKSCRILSLVDRNFVQARFNFFFAYIFLIVSYSYMATT